MGPGAVGLERRRVPLLFRVFEIGQSQIALAIDFGELRRIVEWNEIA